MKWGFWLLLILPIIASQIVINESEIDPEFSVDVESILQKLSENSFVAGSDLDSNGCCNSCGYVWCDDPDIQECIRIWEVECDLIEVDTPH